VAVLLPDNVTPRYEGQDLPAITAALKKYIPNVKVVSYNALADESTQISQAETALTNGAKVLVVIPEDSNAAAAVVNTAHQSNVPVIAYTRIINNSLLDYFIGKDTVAMGKDEGNWLVAHTKAGDNIAVINGSPTDENAKLYNQGYMSVLQPLFDSGQRHLAGSQQWTANWAPADAQTEMEQLLTQTSDNIQAVIGPNDSMDTGIVAALTSANLAGKVALTGLDGTVAGLQRIIAGTQGMSDAQDIASMGVATGEVASYLVKGQKPPSSLFQGTLNNGSVNVPTVFATTKIFDITNLSDAISAGFVTKDQLCKGIPAGTGPC
jgi:D-xylose transport system substrate-binding protein